MYCCTRISLGQSIVVSREFRYGLDGSEFESFVGMINW